LANQEEIIREDILRDRITFRSLLQRYHLLDLIGDENESVAWFRQIMLELAGWVGERERARVILERFKEEYTKQREERERFERAVAAGLPNPYSQKRFRRFTF